MGPCAFNRVCASIRINRDYDVVSVRINAHGVTKRAWAFNCETTVRTCLSRHGKTFIIVIFAKNTLFRSYGVICLPSMHQLHLNPKQRIPKESAEGWKAIDSRDFN